MNIDSVKKQQLYVDFDYFDWYGIPIMVLILFILTILVLRQKAINHRVVEHQDTWGCGYEAPSAKMQYTSDSFSEPILELMPQLTLADTPIKIQETFPKNIEYETNESDVIEENWIIKIAHYIPLLVRPFHFFQNGKTQYYVLYAVLSLTVLILLTVLKIV